MNQKIADITHADILKHFLDLSAALPETRKIISVLIRVTRISGSGSMYAYPNEGAAALFMSHNGATQECVIADGTQRLQYALSVANDDFDLYCMGYLVED